MNVEMVKHEVKEAFHKIAPEVDFDKIKMDLPFRKQVEVDSLDIFNFITLLHKNTGVNIPDSKLSELQNLNELIEFISNQKQ